MNTKSISNLISPQNTISEDIFDYKKYKHLSMDDFSKLAYAWFEGSNGGRSHGGVLPDWMIHRLAVDQNMINPYIDGQISHVDGQKIVSRGNSSFGYDVTLSKKYRIFTNINNTLIDPHNFTPDNYVEREGDYCIIPPNSFILSNTVEVFNIPRNITVICVGKSTIARCGLTVGITPIEAGYVGNITIEITNGSSLPAKVYGGEGIAQFVFLKGITPCRVSYADRGGKYMNQHDIQDPKC